MANQLTDDIYTMKTVKTVSLDDGISWEQVECPHCGSSPLFVVATALDGNINVDPNQRTRWLRCPHCLRGSLLDRGTMHPAPVPLREPGGLPADVAAAWSQVRQCLQVGAPTATVLVSRAILRRLAAGADAADQAAEPGTERCTGLVGLVEHLVAEGYLTARMKVWAERLAPAVDAADDLAVTLEPATARDVASFTLRTLEAFYELDEVMGEGSADS
ncbi:hypothetical protein D9V37_05975 [Nocardioides mangrovicus]|uniref:DUF4145 domain-containing protein n=1 Tax=Nocardioides mangrovicus TaxID=2478913 RepID=A0A3L8P276_9ACTN|nr:hypothetical protein [Nocardioides mangrovicus]RLV49486.1 hypothetical protein D9V37_05975 [Nocardioides mangrovicus]